MIFELAKKLRDMRLKSGLSQKEIAEQIGVSPSVVSAYELGERTPSVEVLMSLAALYNFSSDYLLGLKKLAPQRTLDVSGLQEDQIHALQLLIRTMKNR